MNDATPIWSRPARGSRGPAPGHSREEIVAAAIALADEGGLAAVSMRAVATALGTGAGSLYRYLPSRDALLDLMVDQVAAELPRAPDDGDWLDGMLVLAHGQLDVHARHPWLLDAGGRTAGPGMLAWFDTCLRVLAPVECGTPAKFEAIAMLTGISMLFARAAKAPAMTGFAGADPVAYPWLAAALEQPGEATPDLFDRVLRGLLRGLLS